MTMLDKYQKKAVDHMEGPCLVVAGPGSGKTAVITERIKALTSLHNVKQDRILVITFTKDAAENMKQRFLQISADSSCSVNFGTFHSVFLHILMEEGGYKSTDILFGKEKEHYLKKAAVIAGVKDQGASDFYTTLEKELSYRINCMKNDEKESDNKPVFEAYESLKKRDHRIDFDDMLFLTLKLFVDEPKVLKKWRSRFDYVLVDEVQDMNRLQFRILSLIVYPNNNIFAVGDEDQAIYGFRGSDPSLMMDFPRLYPGCKVLKLENNYRSPNKIIGTAERLIQNNNNRFQKKICPKLITESDMDIKEYCDPIEEIQNFEKMIISDVIKHRSNGSLSGPSSVILYRNNYQGDMIQKILSRGGLKIYRKGDTKKENKNSPEAFVICFFDCIMGNIYRDTILKLFYFSGIMVPRFIISEHKITWDNIINNSSYDTDTMKYMMDMKNTLEMCSRLTPYAAINYFARKFEMDTNRKLRQNLSKDFFERLEYIMEESKTFNNIKSFYNFIKNEDNYKRDTPFDKADVGLFTFHASKGLEFDNVYIPDMNEGITPLLRKTDIDTIEEERRMVYVALTRARSKLIIGTLKSRDNNRLYPSRFIREMGLTL